MVSVLLVIIYAAFISLGLPDYLLGSGWPSMYGEFGVPISYAGIVSMIISGGTIVSSLMSDRMTKKLSAGLVTAVSGGFCGADACDVGKVEQNCKTKCRAWCLNQVLLLYLQYSKCGIMQYVKAVRCNPV